MKRYAPKHTRWLFTGPVVLLLLTLILSACNPDVGGGRSGSPTASAQHGNVHMIPTPGIQLGRQPCPNEVKDLAHWKGIVGIDSTQTVEGVLCGFLMGVPTLQAVVKVRSSSMDRLLDIHVYTSITSTKPTQIFSPKGLLHGDAAVSNYNTLMTAQADPNSSQNKGVPVAQLQTDLYREFKWSDSAGTLIQVAFPGIYPDLTRYQAEFEQGQINTGQGYQQWSLSALTTAQYFAEFVLMWDPEAPTTVVSGGGAHDAMAVILVKNPSAGGETIRVSLSRLELNTNGGIWEVTSIETPGMSITSPQDDYCGVGSQPYGYRPYHAHHRAVELYDQYSICSESPWDNPGRDRCALRLCWKRCDCCDRHGESPLEWLVLTHPMAPRRACHLLGDQAASGRLAAPGNLSFLQRIST